MKNILNSLIPENKKTRILWIGSILLAFLFGWMINTGDSAIGRHDHALQDSETGSVWTCSMHPQIQQPGPGQCPICGMDLISVTNKGGADIGNRQIQLSDNARQLARILVAPVERKFVSKQIRMVGKIEYDESRVRYITARVPGRIDRLFVDYTGIPVKKGDHLVELYSPELVSTQQELIQTIKSIHTTDSPMMRQNLASIHERLRLWGITQGQIDNIEKKGEISDHVTMYAPMSGIVIHKNGVEGLYVKTGSKIYTLADLSRVWVKMDAYESDISWLRYGQPVEFETESYPGEIFKGKIAFIDPVLNEKTRTVKVRVNVKNPGTRLKPGMFIHARVLSKVAAGGKVMDPDISGKWISPMHPEVIKNHPGTCDVCGMPLVKAEELGYVSVENLKKEASIVVPASAPLITGKRAVVYVQLPGEEGIYEGREVVLGSRVGDYYIVRGGLQEGELVVVNGNFKIDSAIQILAKPSMMNPEGGIISTGHQHGPTQPHTVSEKKNQETVQEKIQVPSEFSDQLDKVYTDYFALHFDLSRDDLENAGKNANMLIKSLKKLDMKLLDQKSHNLWMIQREKIITAGNTVIGASSLEEARAGFDKISESLIEVIRKFGKSGKQSVYLYFCPMAFNNRGAYWLQNKEGTENPYFGSKMFTCGSQEEVLSAEKQGAIGEHNHE